jgi:integrase
MSRSQRAASYITGEKGRNRVRTFADPRTGLFYVEYRDGQGKKARTALGHQDFEKAKGQADELAARLRQPKVLDLDSISLGGLFDNYVREVTPSKGSGKQSHDRRTAQLILDVLGTARRVADLTHRDAARYVAERRRRGDLRNGETVRGRPLRARIIGYDVRFFKAVLTWGVNSGLLTRNPLAGFTVPAEAAPRRPVLTARQYEALLGVSEQVHQLFRTALILTHETGHRVGAVRHLRWEDLDFERQLIRWRGEHDKQGYEHETWLTPAAIEALRAAGRSQGVISEWVLPSPTDPSRPVSRHLLRDWWQRGEALAKLPAETGRGWHSLRRKFATELKLVPLKDLCALGGWKSPETVLTCYQQADAVTMQRALDTRQRLEA